ncbi:double zinc ribbon domain-containing protein [Kaarinaea lacus]
MNKWINNIHNRVYYALFPPVCVLCGDRGIHTASRGIDLCKPCHSELPRLTSSCTRCAVPLAGELSREPLCGRCQVRPPAYNRCLSLLHYQPPTDHLIQSLKFQGQLEMARLLGQLMAHWLSGVIDTRPDVLIPVPLHRDRLRERGFNQAVELARPIATQLGCAMDVSSCRRTKITPPQSELSRKERVNNIRGAFQVVKPIQGRVAIIDDVMTTGSTAHELASMLLKAGADSVDVWVFARA